MVFSLKVTLMEGLALSKGYSPHLHRDAKLPHADGLVVRGCYKALPTIDKGDGVNRAQVVIVLLQRVTPFAFEYLALMETTSIRLRHTSIHS